MTEIPLLVLDATPEDSMLIALIARRAASLDLGAQLSPSVVDIALDLVAVHMNGCPLRLRALSEAPDADLMHDVRGIAEHLDRRTGQLLRCFLPRCAAPVEKPATTAKPKKARAKKGAA